MCGIVGYSTRAPQEDPGYLIRMREALLHRGPDDAGAWWSSDRREGLGHRRLAIVDLSPAGHQPMEVREADCQIVFNGEIYNFQEVRRELEELGNAFVSRSDTEVILKAYLVWGYECVDRLVGAFSFAIRDGRRREIFLARDRAGEKPLYYRKDDETFAFASELKALMEDKNLPRKVDAEAMDQYFTYGYVHGARSILQGVHKLLPAHAMVFQLDSREIRTWRYWALPAKAPSNDPEAMDAELEQRLLASLKGQLQADVPVGILLSGGLDSSLLTALAAGAGVGRVKTFTVAFPGHGDFDEGPFARIVVEHFGTDHHELVAEPPSVDLLIALARQFDEPLADDSIVPMALLSGLVRKSVTVALGGDGGDELFGGYPHYAFLQQIESLKKILPGVGRQALAGAGKMLPVGTRGRNHLMGLGGDEAEAMAAINLYFDPTSRRQLVLPLRESRGFGKGAAEGVKRNLYDPKETTLQNATRIDFETTLPGDYLVKVDRASMMSSLEVRAPMLDHRLVEFCFGSLPDAQRVAEGQLKVLLKRFGKRRLPAKLDLARKRGFSLPLADWFKGRWGAFTSEVLGSAGQGIYDARIVEGLLKGQARGLANGNRIFAMVMFELWRREYGVTF